MIKTMQKGFIVPIIIGVVVITIVAVGVMRLFSILPGNVSKKEAKSVISEFASMVSTAKPPTHSGIVADPPWDAIKLVEKFANGKIGKDAKIDFRLTHNWAEKYQEVSTVLFYVSGKPFRWRADFRYGNARYSGIVANDNDEYYSCYSPLINDESYNDSCGKVDSLENLRIPFPFTDFLGTVLDTSRLKLFLTKIPQASIRTIAGREADCLKVEDVSKSRGTEYTYTKTLEICTDKESKLPLYVEAQNNFEQYILEATKLEVSPLTAAVFIPKIPPITAQPSPTPSNDTAYWITYQDAWITFKHPQNLYAINGKQFGDEHRVALVSSPAADYRSGEFVIDSSLNDNLADYNTAVKTYEGNVTNPQINNINGGVVISGTISNQMVSNLNVRYALLKYKSGAILIKDAKFTSIIDDQTFDQILSTFKFTN